MKFACFVVDRNKQTKKQPASYGHTERDKQTIKIAHIIVLFAGWTKERREEKKPSAAIM